MLCVARNAVMGPKGITNKFLAAKRKLEHVVGGSAILVQGDSTGNETDEWVYFLGQYLAAKYPGYCVLHKVWNDTTQQYDEETVISTTDNRGYLLTGSQSSSWRMTIADGASTSPTGDLDVRVRLGLNGALPSAQFAMAAKWGAAGNRAWRFEMLAAGTLLLHHTADGTNEVGSVTSTASVSTITDFDPLTTPFWVRVTVDVDNGAAGNSKTYYYSADGITWTQLGDVKINAGTTSIFDSTSTTQFMGRGGSSVATQDHALKFYKMEAFSSIDGTGKFIDLDVAALQLPAPVTATSQTFIDDCNNVVTVANPLGFAVFEGLPRLVILNSSTPGKQISYSYDATRFPKQAVSSPRICFVNYGHNELATIDYRSTYKTLTDLLVAAYPDAPIVCVLQNPKKLPTAYRTEHLLRIQQIAEFAGSQGFDQLDVCSAWNDDLTGADGIHPTSAGSLLWGQLAQNLFYN